MKTILTKIIAALSLIALSAVSLNTLISTPTYAIDCDVGGIVAAVFIVVGGFNYMTSAGDAGKVAKAKNTIIYALIGLVVCVLAFAIVNWAIGTLDKAA